ncbi:hypothetical protein D3C79_724510 [compost metagenome]
MRVLQPFHRLYTDQHRTDRNEQRLGHAGHGFGLAVAVAVVVIGRAQGVVHGQQIEKGGHAIQRRIGQPGQQADRTAEPPGHRLGQDQDTGHRQRGAGGQAQQALVFSRGSHAEGGFLSKIKQRA